MDCEEPSSEHHGPSSQGRESIEECCEPSTESHESCVENRELSLEDSMELSLEPRYDEVDEPGEHAALVVVVFDYERNEDDELDLKEGEIIFNCEVLDNEFLKGTNQYGHTGIFPSEHVQPIILPQDMEIVQDDQDLSQFVYQESCYDWEPQAKDLEAMLNSQLQVEVDGGNDEYINQRGVTICDYKALRDIELSFPKGAIIEHIHISTDLKWWVGRHEGVMGFFMPCLIRLVPDSYEHNETYEENIELEPPEYDEQNEYDEEEEFENEEDEASE